MITNLHKNRLGTISLEGKFPGQRKPQDFVVYPIKAGEDGSRVLVQSDKRIGYIYLDSGTVALCPSQSGGAYFQHLPQRTPLCKLSAQDLFSLKAHVFSTAHGAAGKAENGFIQCDNSGALEVFA